MGLERTGGRLGEEEDQESSTTHVKTRAASRRCRRAGTQGTKCRIKAES